MDLEAERHRVSKTARICEPSLALNWEARLHGEISGDRLAAPDQRRRQGFDCCSFGVQVDMRVAVNHALRDVSGDTLRGLNADVRIR